MFTGYIEHRGHISRIIDLNHGKRLYIECDYDDLSEGESIAVDGVCLTVSAHQPHEFACDVSPETLQVSHIANFQVGTKVNLERSLRLTDRLHGHFVMGHVDQICRLAAKTDWTDFQEYRFSGVQPEARKFLVPKGSIAINGVSLTLNQIDEDGFEVMLIPETLHRTNLVDLAVGQMVNVEYDYLAKIVVNYTPLPLAGEGYKIGKYL